MIVVSLFIIWYFLLTTTILKIPAYNDAGAHVNQITEVVTPQGYSAGDIKMAINELSNEGHIYSTVDENNYQYAQ